MSAAPLALLHGWGMNAAAFDAIRGPLAVRHALIDIELPGHGANRSLPDDAGLQAWADAIAARLPAGCALLAWSLGALLAMSVAIARPRALRRLALVSATPRFLRAPGWQAGVEPDEFERFATQLRRDPAGALARFHGLQAQGDAHARPVLRELQRVAAAAPAPDPAALSAGLAQLCTADLRGRLASICLPVLVVAGSADRLTPPEAGKGLAAGITGARLATISGASHAPFISDPAAFLRETAAFFADND